MLKRAILSLVCLCVLIPDLSAGAKLQVVARDPYVGAAVIDADSGGVLFADKADVIGYPASVLKLMDLLVILDMADQGRVRLDDQVTVTAEAARIGGSQVYLKEHEVFTVDDLLYALMIQSANDAATALAIHVAGSKSGFVALMNEKARALGMDATRFHSVHGLPPGPGQEPDVTTARDLAVLGRALAGRPAVFQYTSTRERPFRANLPQPFIMRNHNNLLSQVEGCDGFKTGFFSAAGFSVLATAQREGRRVICAVLGSTSKQTRDAKAAELISKGFLILPPKAASSASAVPAVQPVPAPAAAAVELPDEEGGVSEVPAAPSFWKPFLLGLVVGVGGAGLVTGIIRLRRRDRGDFVGR